MKPLSGCSAVPSACVGVALLLTTGVLPAQHLPAQPGGAPLLAAAGPDILPADPVWSGNPLLAVSGPHAALTAAAATEPVTDPALVVDPDDTLFTDEELLEGTPVPDPTPGSRASATSASMTEVTVDDAALAEEETEVPVAPPPRAGTGFLGFFNFGEVPSWFDAFSQDYLPYGGISSFVAPGPKHRAGPFRYGLGLSAGAAYTDNIEGSSNDRRGDVIWTFTPSIYIEAGEEANIRLLYAPTFEIYTADSEQSFVNQTLLLTWQAPFKRLQLGGGVGYTTRRGVFADSNNIATLDTYSANIYAAYPIFPRTIGRIEYGIGVTHGDPGGTQVENVVTLSAQHALTSRINVGAYVGGGLVTAPANDQRYLTAGLNATYAVTTRLALNASVGAQFRDLDNAEGDLLVTPVAQIGAVWTPTNAINVYAGFFRDVGVDSFETSQTNVRTGGNLGASFALARNWVFDLNGALAYVEEIGNGNDSDDSEFVFGFAEAALTYKITSWASLRAFYNFSARGSIENAENFTRNTVGIGASITF